MRLLMVTPGTRGDVAPMAGLGQKLAAHGFEVSIAANAAYEPDVAAAGCTFRDLPGDISAIVNPAPPGTKASAKLMRDYIRELQGYFELAATGTLAAAEHQADAIIANSVAPFAFDIAEALGIPAISAQLQPNEPSRSYAPVILGTARSFGAAGNLALGHLIASAKAPYDPPTARVRATLELPKRSRATSERQRRRRQLPILHGFSSAVVPRPNDWHEGISNCGYWWPATNPAWTPDSTLLDFLQDGEPPVFIGFGSTNALEQDFMVDVARRSGRRFILQGVPGVRESNILGVGNVPHQSLFPRVAAVVHHAGAGTTAAGLRAGVPAVPVPIFTDQPFWAARIHELGAGVQPMAFKNLGVEQLAAAIEQAVSNDRYALGARRIAEQLTAEEDSTLPVVRALRRLAPGR